MCLDRGDCHSSYSSARLSECGHCGAYNWQFNPSTGRLAEDWSSNCVDRNGGIRHCGDGQVEWISFCRSDAHTVTGEWMLVGEGIPTTQTFTYSVASTQSLTKSQSKSHSNGFSFKGISASTESTMSSQLSHTLGMSASDECQVTFAEGSRYRWVFLATDECGHETMVPTCTFVQPDKGKLPCCVPGDFIDGKYQICKSGPSLC